MKKIGIIDYFLNEWHANNYPRIFKGACEKVGGEFEFAYAYGEIENNGVTTDAWCAERGIKKCETIEELCEKSDFIMILSPNNPEKHLEYAKKVFKYRKPTFIDKTFAPDAKTAREIFDLAKEYDAPFFSTSSLRYAVELEGLKGAESVIAYGGGGHMKSEIIHEVEIIVSLIDELPTRVKVERLSQNQIISHVEFENGKKGAMVFSVYNPFMVSVEKDKTPITKPNLSGFFNGLMEDIIRFYTTSKFSFDAKETIIVAEIVEAYLKGLDKLGEWIEIKR